MRTKKLFIAAAFLLIPILIRALWFYPGVPFRSKKLGLPDYEEITLQEPRISTPILNAAQNPGENTTILVDQAHGNIFNLTEIESLHSELLLRGANIITAEDSDGFNLGLQKSDALLIIAPTDPFTSDEVENVEEFVSRGGRLLVAADPTRSNADNIADKEAVSIQTNQLLQPFGLLFNNDYVYNLYENEGNYRNVYVKPSGFSNLTLNLNSLVFYGSHSIGIFGQPVIAGDENTASSLTDAGEDLPVAALDESGSVLAIGDVTFMTNPYYQVEDNYLFIQNIADFLVNSQRIKNLKDFPDLFTQDIGILLTSDIELDKDILEILSDMQSRYARDDLQITLLEVSQEGFDEIILGTYPPDDDLKPWTDEIGFVYENGVAVITPTPTPEAAETEDTATPTPEPINNQIQATERSIIVPEFGAIPRSGFGFMVLNSTEGKTRLFILADSQENCINLLDLVSSGSLSGCLVGDTVAICEQDIKINHLEEEGFEEVTEEEFLDELSEQLPTQEGTPAAPTPEQTPTPED